MPSPPTIILHGLSGTGKTSLLRALLPASTVPYALIPCAECITVRHLFERIVSACITAVESRTEHHIDRAPYARCETVAALAAHLQRLLGRSTGKFVLALDRADRIPDASPTLLPALARFHELVRPPCFPSSMAKPH